MGYTYAELGAGLSRDPLAQDRYRQVDATCKEAIRRFIVDFRLQIAGLADQSAIANLKSAIASADAYLKGSANIAPGSLDAIWHLLGDLQTKMSLDHETSGLLNALAGGYIPPSPGNDVVRNPAVVPTGRNIHGLDPFRIPSAAAQVSGARVVEDLLARLTQEQGALPETVALILWGTDNIKTEGEGVAQALALLGARVITDELGKVADVVLIPLKELGRPRIDIVATVSGIFRDLMAMQAQLIDKAVRLAAAADEPTHLNYVCRHVLAQTAELGISVDEAASRVFSNAPGSYGANVNNMVESGSWEDDAQIGDIFMARKGFAMDKRGEWQAARPILEQALSTVQATFQNVDSVEVGISDVDHYYEYLGGVTKSVEKLRGSRPPVMLAEVEAFSGPGGGRVRSLEQMVRLESRAKLLNPKWFEGMLAHGYEGVREIEVRVSNTYGWSATSNAVEGWVYQGVAETYLLDEAMRERLATLNPHAAAGVARRLADVGQFVLRDLDDLVEHHRGLGQIYGAQQIASRLRLRVHVKLFGQIPNGRQSTHPNGGTHRPLHCTGQDIGGDASQGQQMRPIPTARGQGKNRIAVKGRMHGSDCPSEAVLGHLRQLARLRFAQLCIRGDNRQGCVAHLVGLSAPAEA